MSGENRLYATAVADASPVARWNPVEAEWVLNVPSRAGLPARADVAPETRLISPCPFCPGSDETPGEYDVLVVPSRYPIVDTSGVDGSATAGRHSVFLFTSDHFGRLVDQSVPRVVELFDALANESSTFLAFEAVQTVFAFLVSGDYFGPTVDHPHGQLIGFPFVPRRLVLDELEGCTPCSMAATAHELTVSDLDGAVVVVPEFARLPFEMWVVPTRHVGRLQDLNYRESERLARAMLVALGCCLDSNGVMPQHLLTIMQAPRTAATEHHLRVEIVPLHRPNGGIKRAGGVEIGAGVYVNAVDPYSAASMLRARVQR